MTVNFIACGWQRKEYGLLIGGSFGIRSCLFQLLPAFFIRYDTGNAEWPDVLLSLSFLDQSNCVADGVSNFLVGLDVIQFVPALCVVVDLSKTGTVDPDVLEDSVNHPDLFGSIRRVHILSEAGTDGIPEVLVPCVVRKDVPPST